MDLTKYFWAEHRNSSAFLGKKTLCRKRWNDWYHSHGLKCFSQNVYSNRNDRLLYRYQQQFPVTCDCVVLLHSDSICSYFYLTVAIPSFYLLCHQRGNENKRARIKFRISDIKLSDAFPQFSNQTACCLKNEGSHQGVLYQNCATVTGCEHRVQTVINQ